ncbi:MULTISPECIES: DUF6586 family protein [unclassified Acinetobacter]|uniref:DUF6586 family protein n=1 Tax=unclassified Acinetobacter TaxID=196816 RepID=UPI0035B9DE5E
MTRVARHHADRTNQKLYFAQLTLNQMQDVANQQQLLALQESCNFHLYGAILALVQEIARFYHTKANLVQHDIRTLMQDLTQHNAYSPELQRVGQLLQEGFLADIVHAYQDCLANPKPSTQAAVARDDMLLIATSNAIDDHRPDAKQLQAWHQMLQQLVMQLRDGLQEY